MIFSEGSNIPTTEYVFNYSNNSLLEIRSSEKDAKIKVIFEGHDFPSKLVDQDGNTLVVRYGQHGLIQGVKLSSSTQVISSTR